MSVPATNLHRRDWETLSWPISRTFTLHAITWHRPPRWLPLYIPWHSVGDMLVSMIRSGFKSPTERSSFEARTDIQTPDTSTSQTECGLQLYLNFSKSARAYNVSLCFDFYLNVTSRVLFSVALNHRGRGTTLETSGFSCPFNTHFDKLCKSDFQRGPLPSHLTCSSVTLYRILAIFAQFAISVKVVIACISLHFHPIRHIRHFRQSRHFELRGTPCLLNWLVGKALGIFRQFRQDRHFQRASLPSHSNFC